MCGEKLKLLSRSIGLFFLVLLLFSGGSLWANAYDELTLILTSYEQIYENLELKMNSLSSRLTDLEASQNKQVTLSKSLEGNLNTIQLNLPMLEENLSKSQARQTVLESQIKGFETSYLNMEKDLKISRRINKSLLGTVSGIIVGSIVNHFVEGDYWHLIGAGLGLAFSFAF